MCVRCCICPAAWFVGLVLLFTGFNGIWAFCNLLPTPTPAAYITIVRHRTSLMCGVGKEQEVKQLKKVGCEENVLFLQGHILSTIGDVSK